MAPTTPKYAYATVITRPSYLAGIILLAYTLHKYSPSHPLIVLYTPSTLPSSCVTALESESHHSNLILHPISPLLPQNSDPKNIIAEHFADTWTKLRVFELHSFPCTKICFLDADMLVLRDPSSVFDTELPEHDGLLATHVCICNLEHDPRAPPSWTPANCAYTGLTHPSALSHPTPVTPNARPEHQLLNPGMFVFAPSRRLCERLMRAFEETQPETLAAYKFPDQDFLTEFFRGRWTSVGYQFNALKTMRYWHPNMWDDDSVCCLHYIVDKPWAARVGEGEVAGYKGDDGVTHEWWWEEFGEWEKDRGSEEELVKVVRQYVAGENGEEKEELRALGSQAQAFARNKGAGEPEQRTHGPVLRKKMLGERGHGPVVRNLGKVGKDEHRDDGSCYEEHHEHEEPQQGSYEPILRKKMLGERGHGPVVHPQRNQEQTNSEGNADEQQADQEPQQAPHGPVLRKKMLGERGHGPVVRGNGRSMMEP